MFLKHGAAINSRAMNLQARRYDCTSNCGRHFRTRVDTIKSRASRALILEPLSCVDIMQLRDLGATGSQLSPAAR